MVRRAILASMLCWSTAHASPRTDPTLGRSVFTGAASPSATAIDINPAALGLGKFSEFYFSLSGVLDQVGIQPKTLDVTSGMLSDGEAIHATEAGAGVMIAGVYHVGDRVTLGGAAHTPPPEKFPPGYGALQYHTLGGNQRNFVATFAASFRATSGLYFGASLSHE